jgi:HEAT repeat protein
LLEDRDPEVVSAALDALRAPEDDGLVSVAVGHLANRYTASAAVGALERGGLETLVAVDEGLGGNELARHSQEMLVRAAREIGGAPAVATLLRHVTHQDREVGLSVMTALAALIPLHSHELEHDIDVAESAGVVADLVHATHVLRGRTVFADQPAADVLCMALGDELELLRRRVLATLSMRHGVEGIQRVAFQLSQRDARTHALALEWLDVTLIGADRAVVPLFEPSLSDRERLQALAKTFPLASMDRYEILLDLAHDPDDRWRRPWLAACALYSAAEMTDVDLETLIDAATATGETDAAANIVTETVACLRERHERSTW